MRCPPALASGNRPPDPWPSGRLRAPSPCGGGGGGGFLRVGACPGFGAAPRPRSPPPGAGALRPVGFPCSLSLPGGALRVGVRPAGDGASGGAGGRSAQTCGACGGRAANSPRPPAPPPARETGDGRRETGDERRETGERGSGGAACAAPPPIYLSSSSSHFRASEMWRSQYSQLCDMWYCFAREPRKRSETGRIRPGILGNRVFSGRKWDRTAPFSVENCPVSAGNRTISEGKRCPMWTTLWKTRGRYTGECGRFEYPSGGRGNAEDWISFGVLVRPWRKRVLPLPPIVPQG